MANEEKRMINHYPAPRLYIVNRAEYKLMVRSLTSIYPGSSGQTSVSVPTQGQVSNPQPLRLNDASIPLGSSGQTSLGLQTQTQVSNPFAIRLYDASIPQGSCGQTSFPLLTQAHVSNSQAIRLYDVPIPAVSSGQTNLLCPTQAHVRNPRPIGLYGAFPLHNRSLPYPFPQALVWPSTSAVGASDAQASSSQPSLPSPSIPPSPPSISLPPSASVVPARLPTPSLPPPDPVLSSPPREQGAMEPSLAARIESVEKYLNEDGDDYNSFALSPFNHETGIGNGEQQQENVAPPVLINVPSGSLNLPVQQNGVTMPMSKHVPYESQLGWTNLQNALQQEIVPANLPYGQTAYGGSSSLANYPNTQEDMERYLAQVGFGTVPSWDLNWNTYPRVVHRSTDVPSSSSPPANLPPDNPQE